MSSTTDDTKRQMSEPGLRVSKLPEDIRAEVGRLNLDKDEDGKINLGELRDLIVDLLSTKKDIKSLRKVTIVLAIYGIFLTFAIFGVSIAAARLAKDTTVDAETGNLQVKGSKDGQLIHTSPVSYYLDTLDVVGMENDDLSAVSDIILGDGAVELSIKGYSRSLVKNQVTFLVDGGTVLYGTDGYVSATGTAETLLAFAAYSDDDNATSSDEGVRRLQGENPYNKCGSDSDCVFPKLCDGFCKEKKSSLKAGSPPLGLKCGFDSDCHTTKKCTSGHCGVLYKGENPYNKSELHQWLL